MAAGALAAPAWLCLLVLALGGWIGAAPAVIAALACLAGAALAWARWARERRDLVIAADRLARTLAARGEEVTALARASEAIVERLPDPLIVLNPQRGVQRANAAARAAFGADIAAVLRHPVLGEAIDRAARGPEATTAEISVPAPTPREVAATVLPFEPPLADGGSIILVLSNRSRERALERTRADFVANASHELRTPLASLTGFIETLRGPAAGDREAQARFLAIMAEQASRMANLIDDLLSLSRIEMSEHQPPADQVDLGALAQRVAAGFEPRLAARAMRLDLAIEKGIIVVGDAGQLAQVVQNLVDNALKYGREGGTVRIVVAGAHGAPFPARKGVVLAVSDDGPGIPRAHLPRLTERFYRVDKARSRSAGGTGLGLAIVKHIVVRHRGQLLVESEEGRGSTFSVWLPA